MQNNTKFNKTTEKRIMDTATKLFAQKGFDGASTREICKLAEINISLISYYFGGKKELYHKIVTNIVEKIIAYMKSKIGFGSTVPDFSLLNKEEKMGLLFKALEMIIDYFYSDKISDSEIMLLYKEQMESGVPLNAEGYKFFKKLLASILEKNENDKEVIFRALTIVGQIHSARIMRQFSLNMMDQSGYSKEDIQMLKQIITDQTKSILKDVVV